MTKRKGKAELIDVKELLERDEDFLQAALQALLQAALEAEMSETIGAEKGERTEARLSYRSGYYSRSLITRVGTLELRVPQDRGGRFSTELFERYERSEKALVGTLAISSDCVQRIEHCPPVVGHSAEEAVSPGPRHGL